MASIINALTSAGGVSITPDTSGVLQFATNGGTTAVSASSTNTVTNKISVNIGGTTYYLLVSTSGA